MESSRLVLTTPPCPVLAHRYRPSITLPNAFTAASMSETILATRNGSPSSSPTMLIKPPYGCSTESLAGRSLLGPVEPKPLIEQKTSFGFISARAWYPMPMRSITPGRNASTTTSAVLQRRAAMSLAACCRRSRHMPRLLRFMLAKVAVMPIETLKAPISRAQSPRGGSILITSAPWSPRSCAQ